MTTPHQAKYWALALTTSGQFGSIGSLTRSISNACVDLNPHQVDAALFGLKSPISKGAILADEVGLGKTIEAGLVLVQKWAERKRKILLIVPATLRKQWQQELNDKFFLPSVVLESSSYKKAVQEGSRNPFDQVETIVICSYQFASAKKMDISSIPWDLAVIDEAHRLRNVYKTSAKIAVAVKESLVYTPKLLLTATPLQNSLLELYGLVSIIDDNVFGDRSSFSAQFLRKGIEEQDRNSDLKERLSTVCKRTLRKQANEYVRFTNRLSITEKFMPTEEEHLLYEQVSAYLQRDKLIALPSAQRKLITLVLRKLLASSTFAIGATLKKLVSRLDEIRNPSESTTVVSSDDETDDVISSICDEYESIGSLKEEWDGDGGESVDEISAETKEEVEKELVELAESVALADRITSNAKGDALIRALRSALEKAETIGGKRKAVVFTESRRTQDYLFRMLSENGYEGQLAMLNGTNTDALSKKIYAEWIERHKGEAIVAGAKAVDIKAAIVEEFKDRATILIATEAAAEGVNLQFCSLVVNYDLPWNPQRIEQRIGRCHRYGQDCDVVVVNFLNLKNAADQRVFQLLSEKFRLFDGVFGASDEVLGAVESGMDIEKRIADLYQRCRTVEEIQTAFDSLQLELDEQIQNRLANTRQAILENFDEEVHARLKMHQEQAKTILDQRYRWLLDLTKHELKDNAEFFADNSGFEYSGTLAPVGTYRLPWKNAEEHGGNFYRPDSTLAQVVLNTALSRSIVPAHLEFNLSEYPMMISVLKEKAGKSGHLDLSLLTVSSMQDEQFLILSGQTDEGEIIDAESCNKLLSVPARILTEPIDAPADAVLAGAREAEIEKHLGDVHKRNIDLFEEEMNKLDRWAEDLKYGLEQELKEIDVDIRQTRKTSKLALSLQDKLDAQKQIKSLEQKRNAKRRRLFDAQDEIDGRRDRLIEDIEKQIRIQSKVEPVFTLRWSLVG